MMCEVIKDQLKKKITFLMILITLIKSKILDGFHLDSGAITFGIKAT